MPFLPTPAVKPDGGDLVVKSEQDVLDLLPLPIRRSETAPIRDVMVAGVGRIHIEIQEAVSLAAALSDVTRSEGPALRELCSEWDILPASEDEDDEMLRARFFDIGRVASPTAIKSICDDVLADYTIVPAQTWESVCDRALVFEPTDSYHCFVGDGTVDVSPHYPDRYYEAIGTAYPGGAFVFDDEAGHLLVVRLPDIGGKEWGWAYPGDVVSTGGTVGCWLYDGSFITEYATFAGAGQQFYMAIYNRIAGMIDDAIGDGLEWMLNVDSKPRFTP